jgi:hypothetical protein
MTKFYEKNKENIDRLDKFIVDNEDDILKIRISPELRMFFEEHYGLKEKFENQYELRKIRIYVDNYQPARRIYFIRKSESIDFNLPCIGGIYHDEPHELR